MKSSEHLIRFLLGLLPRFRKLSKNDDTDVIRHTKINQNRFKRIVFDSSKASLNPRCMNKQVAIYMR